MNLPMPRLLILPTLAALLALAIPATPASAIFDPPPVDCPCWDDGGPFYTPAAFCHKATTTRFGYVTGTFAQTVTFGAVSYCRNNGMFAWTSPDEHAACNVALHLACSPLSAVAYIDRNDNDVFDWPDGLIAKLVDTDGNGPDEGDAMVTDVYPAALGSTAAGGEFTVKTTACNAGTVANANFVRCAVAPEDLFIWDDGAAGTRDRFTHLFDNTITISVGDEKGSCPEQIVVTAADTLQPTVASFVGACRPADENHIDVDLF